MKPYKKSLRAKTTVTNFKFTEPYWDEGIYYYPKWRPGFKNSNRVLMSYQIRMYRTWKHNRKTQWK